MDSATLLGTPPQDNQEPVAVDDTTDNTEDQSVDSGDTPESTQEPTQDQSSEDQSSEDKDTPANTPGVQKRIDQLVAQIHDTRRENKQLQEDIKFARNHLDTLQQQVQQATTSEPLPELPEDATPEDLKTYFDEMTRRQNEQMQANMAKLEMEGKINACRAKFPDFDELHRKFETTCLNNEVLKTRIQSSPNPPEEFYNIAKSLDGKIEEQGQRVTQAAAADVGGTTRTGGEAAKPKVSDDEWATVQRVFPGKFKDRDDYLKEKQIGDSLRAARRRASNGQG